MNRAAHPSRAARDGAALVVALWVIGLLSLLVLSFIFDAHIQSRIISYYRKRTQAEYLARSGLEVARLLMSRAAEAAAAADDDSIEPQLWHEAGRRLAQGLAVQGLERELGGGRLLVDIVPEPARRNVNRLTEEDWERLFELAGLPEEYWPTLIESFEDWLDSDDDPRLDGAETDDYYASLEQPYRCKNGPLDTVGELLLIRGFTRALLYGGPLLAEDGRTPVRGRERDGEPLMLAGIEDLLTTYGDGKVNVNAASSRVLQTLPGVDDIVAGAIIEEREGLLLADAAGEDTSFKSVSDFFARLPEVGRELEGFITTDSSIFRVTCVGEVGNVTRRIWSIVRLSGAELRILRWREE